MWVRLQMHTLCWEKCELLIENIYKYSVRKHESVIHIDPIIIILGMNPN